MLLAGDKTAVLLEKSLGAAVLRYEVIANNLANVDTPGFKKSFVLFEEELQSAIRDQGAFRLRHTHPNHIGGPDTIEDVQPEVKKDTVTSERLEGNNVDIEEEMTKLVMNSINYYFAAQQINKKLAMLRYVISDGRG